MATYAEQLRNAYNSRVGGTAPEVPSNDADVLARLEQGNAPVATPAPPSAGFPSDRPGVGMLGRGAPGSPEADPAAWGLSPEQGAAYQQFSTAPAGKAPPEAVAALGEKVQPMSPPAGTAGAMSPGDLTFGGRPDAGGVSLPKPVTIGAHEQALVDPKRQKEIASALDAQRTALGDARAAETHAAQNAGVAAGLKAQALDDQSKDITGKANARAADQQRMQDAIDSMSKDVADQKIDPDHYIKNASTASKLGFIIAAGLGGYASTRSGGPNVAVQMLQKSIDDDIAAQRNAIELKKGRVGDMKGALAEAYRRTGNLEQAEAVARVAVNNAIDAKAAQYAAGANSEKVNANYEQLSAGLQAQNAETMAKMNKYVPAQTVAGGGGIGKGSVDNKLVVPMGDGKGIVARSEQEAQKIREKLAAKETITQGLAELKSMDQGATFADRANPMSAFNQQKSAKLAQLRTRATVFEGQGAMSKGDADNTNEAIGALTGLAQYTGNQTKIIDNAIHGFNASVEQELRGQDGLVVHQGIAQDAHGNIQQTWTPSGESYGAKAKPANPVDPNKFIKPAGK